MNVFRLAAMLAAATVFSTAAMARAGPEAPGRADRACKAPAWGGPCMGGPCMGGPCMGGPGRDGAAEDGIATPFPVGS